MHEQDQSNRDARPHEHEPADQQAPPSPPQWLGELEAIFGDRLRYDPLSRTAYSTDASIYSKTPIAIVMPENAAEVSKALRLCHKHKLPAIARGAGTGLTGGALGEGVVLDLSRHMNRISRLDVKARSVEVEPGVVLDELNAFLAPHDLQFAPDVATGNRATIGGMIGNNSCGAHSLLYGQTSDHILGLTAVLDNGDAIATGHSHSHEKEQTPGARQRVSHIEAQLARLRNENHQLIKDRYPKISRNNAGYALNRLGEPGDKIDLASFLCGSEGTLGIVTSAKLKLTALPKAKGAVLLPFDHLLDALSTVQHILPHRPAAVELIDNLVLEAGKLNPTLAKQCSFIKGTPKAILVVEFYGEKSDFVDRHIGNMLNDDKVTALAASPIELRNKEQQQSVWKLRKYGLGLLMSKPGDDQPYAFVEDTCVDPSKLAEYIEAFDAIISDEGARQAGHYAHASVGCLHVRPVLNLKSKTDIDRMRRIAERVSELAIKFEGTVTSEHGDGMLRSCWLEKLYGSDITQLFAQVKDLFDPNRILNPGKIVDPGPMDIDLRYGPDFSSSSPNTFLDFSGYGGMSGLAEMCSGVGVCRQRQVDTMCPSYRATGDELQTTRARANAFRVALSKGGLLNGLDDPALEQVMDLCLACKACKSECPTGVDMAKLKAELLNRRNQRDGVPKRSRLVANMPRLAQWGSRFPRLANLIMQSGFARSHMQRQYGLDRRVPPPRFAKQTFRSWFRKRTKGNNGTTSSHGPVVYFVDTWTNHFVPSVGRAAVALLEAAGFEVLCPDTVCCGRPMISHGLLAEAKQQAETNIRILSRTAPGSPIVGTEPSCILTLSDEYPQLVRTIQAAQVASRSQMIETFLWNLIRDDRDALPIAVNNIEILYHAHCHQSAVVGSDDAVSLMNALLGKSASEIPSGCCGMAGSFGHEVEHYDVAKAVAEETLLPAIRNRGNAKIAVSGFSCRQQIDHHSDATSRHLIEYLADALTATTGK